MNIYLSNYLLGYTLIRGSSYLNEQTMNNIMLEEKLSNVKLSYNRQLSLSGHDGYDPKLTFDLKKDIEWFEQEKRILERIKVPASVGNKDY